MGAFMMHSPSTAADGKKKELKIFLRTNKGMRHV
jgi:hypothetical protein